MKVLSTFFIIGLFLLIGCQPATENTTTDQATDDAFKKPPEWAKDVVWYQIMVERFRNGDPSNDPTIPDMERDNIFIPPTWTVTPWTQDWYKPDPYFSELKDGTFDGKVQQRRYGGDLQGVLDQIPYLDSLGVTAIYFNPLNDAPSLHKYDAQHWRHIDRTFGPEPQKDLETIDKETPLDPATWQFTAADQMFLEVINELHKRNIKVILDYSWNHTGTKFWAWEDVVKNQEASPYKDWYWVSKFDNPETETNEFDYRGWIGIKALPEIKETEFVDHSDRMFAYEGDLMLEEVKEHIFNVTKRWLDPNGDGNPDDGVDGFRLDVAAELPLGFWREYRKVVRDVNPQAYLVGEVWWEKWPDDLLDPAPYLQGDVFDAVMNYRWYRLSRQFFAATPNPVAVTAFVDGLEQLGSHLNEANNYAMMNLVSSHDVPRVSTSLYNKNKYKYYSTPFGDSTYRINKPDAATYQTLRLLLMHQFTYIGAPHIWAGEEMGMWGADDPSTRKPLIWPDYTFETERAHPLGGELNDPVKFDAELFTCYQKLAQIRKAHQSLRQGSIDFVVADDSNNVLAYSRQHEGQEVIAVFNLGETTKQVSITVKSNQYSDLFSGDNYQAAANNIQISLAPRSAMILSNGQ